MHFIIYETKNLVNNKVYRGAHKCKSLDDGYLGSSRVLNNAIKKYGKQNFLRSILEFCKDIEHMYEREKFWVDKDFVERHDTYNQKIGGLGGFAKHSDDTKMKISKARTGKTWHHSLNGQNARPSNGSLWVRIPLMLLSYNTFDAGESRC